MGLSDGVGEKIVMASYFLLAEFMLVFSNIKNTDMNSIIKSLLFIVASWLFGVSCSKKGAGSSGSGGG
jgi:hypothetical protein